MSVIHGIHKQGSNNGHTLGFGTFGTFGTLVDRLNSMPDIRDDRSLPHGDKGYYTLIPECRSLVMFHRMPIGWV